MYNTTRYGARGGGGGGEGGRGAKAHQTQAGRLSFNPELLQGFIDTQIWRVNIQYFSIIIGLSWD